MKHTRAPRKRLWTHHQIFDAVLKVLYRDDVPGIPAMFLIYAAALVNDLDDRQIVQLHEALSAAAKPITGGAR